MKPLFFWGGRATLPLVAASFSLGQEGARWRQNAPSPKQEALARKLGVRLAPGWSSGEVSDAIVAITGEWYD